MDQMSAQVDHKRLRVPEIAESLSVTVRTVYSMIEREGWKKEEGARGRVWYHVPVSFIDEYIATSQEDQKNIHSVSGNYTEPSQPVFIPSFSPAPEATVTFSNDQFIMMLGDKETRIAELKEDIKGKNEQIIRLQAALAESEKRVAEAEKRVSRLEGEMSGKSEAIQQLEARLLEKDENLKAAIKSKDETIAAKDQAINAANAAVMLLEEKKMPALETSAPKRQEESRPPSWMFWKH